eukprot:COSAG06_NODE_48437_length_332_cov_0.665236_1_plen_33_part_10
MYSTVCTIPFEYKYGSGVTGELRAAIARGHAST